VAVKTERDQYKLFILPPRFDFKVNMKHIFDTALFVIIVMMHCALLNYVTFL